MSIFPQCWAVFLGTREWTFGPGEWGEGQHEHGMYARYGASCSSAFYILIYSTLFSYISRSAHRGTRRVGSLTEATLLTVVKLQFKTRSASKQHCLPTLLLQQHGSLVVVVVVSMVEKNGEDVEHGGQSSLRSQWHFGLILRRVCARLCAIFWAFGGIEAICG